MNGESAEEVAAVSAIATVEVEEEPVMRGEVIKNQSDSANNVKNQVPAPSTALEEEDSRDNRSHVAPIKPEFILPIVVNDPSSTDNRSSVGHGQNKNRQFNFHSKSELSLCNRIALGEECNNEGCKRTHDLQEYLASKEPELPGPCPIYSQYGHCPTGLRCRFSSSHGLVKEEEEEEEDRNGVNVMEVEKRDANGLVYLYGVANRINYSTLLDMRKRRYEFSLTKSVMKSCVGGSGAKHDPVEPAVNGDDADDLAVGPLLCENTADNLLSRSGLGLRRHRRRGKIDWKGKTYLAPLTTVGNLPFRRVCKDFGVDITCGEMAMVDQILKGSASELALLKRHESEDLFGVQLCGGNQEIMLKCVEMLNREISVDFIDINLGCPIDSVFQRGWGSGLINRPPKLRGILSGLTQVSKHSSVPITVKLRTGVYEGKRVAHKLLPMFHECGIEMVALHGRTRQQRYTRLADWQYIGECAEIAQNQLDDLPLFGNGDILSHEDYYAALDKYPTISGIMIGRGALIKPWLFTEIKERRHWDIRSGERMDILRRFCNYGLTHWGSDCEGVNKTRRYLLEWLSFLYRYIPVGLLERLPQRMNERPPRYQGRDDLETLMASDNVQDWIQISEMLLGKTPDGFNFLPKHKSNAYESG